MTSSLAPYQTVSRRLISDRPTTGPDGQVLNAQTRSFSACSPTSSPPGLTELIVAMPCHAMPSQANSGLLWARLCGQARAALIKLHYVRDQIRSTPRYTNSRESLPTSNINDSQQNPHPRSPALGRMSDPSEFRNTPPLEGISTRGQGSRFRELPAFPLPWFLSCDLGGPTVNKIMIPD